MFASHRTLARIVLGFLLCSAALLLVAPMLLYPFGRDQGMFACGADVLRRGGTLYRDFWDVKPPGVYYLYWLSFLAFGRSMLAPRVMDLLFSLATAGGLVIIGRRLVSPWAGLAAALLFLSRYALCFGYWDTAQADGFASLPLTVAALVMLEAERRSSWRLAILCGALIGFAVIAKFTLGIFLLLPLVVLAVSRREGLVPRLARAAGYLLGCALVVGVVVLPIWRAGALEDMWETMFSWNSTYATIRGSGFRVIVGQTWRFWFGRDYLVLRLMGMFALIGLATLVLRREGDRLRWTPAAWLALMLVQVCAQGKYFGYHWLPLLPPFTLLAGIGITGVWLALRVRVKPVSVAKGVAAAGLAMMLALLVVGYRATFSKEIARVIGRMPTATYLDSFRDRQDYSLTADQQVAAFLRERTTPERSIFIWGFEPVIYFLADRPPASRFVCHPPLVTSWSPPEWREELIRDLTQQRPDYIVIAHNDQMPWVTLRPYDSWNELDFYPALADLLRHNYRPEVRIEDLDLWRRKAALP
jgi:hypothetical protein